MGATPTIHKGIPKRMHNKGTQTLSVRVIFNQRTWRSADVALTDRRSTWFSAARNPVGEHLDHASACCFPPLRSVQNGSERTRTGDHLSQRAEIDAPARQQVSEG